MDRACVTERTRRVHCAVLLYAIEDLKKTLGHSPSPRSNRYCIAGNLQPASEDRSKNRARQDATDVSMTPLAKSPWRRRADFFHGQTRHLWTLASSKDQCVKLPSCNFMGRAGCFTTRSKTRRPSDISHFLFRVIPRVGRRAEIPRRAAWIVYTEIHSAHALLLSL